MYKKFINVIFNATDAFNKEWHANIERNVIEASKQFHTNEEISLEERDKNTKQMREFYYARMSNSSNFLIALSSFFISSTALIVAIIALGNGA
ncbi:hypothetical protein [Shewanella frigidimarina]|uniref:hypothetical protein n=1 Tax=Shewanella frigidimarina TaxID=56812 RepID=UPI003D7BB429